MGSTGSTEPLANAAPRDLDPASTLVAVGWGLAEATLFFIVPDVWLSYLALKTRRAALIGCIFATAGAVVGGLLMFGWGASDPARARDALDRVPAVSAAMIERVETDLSERGLGALFLGPFVGTPYKIYAASAPGAGIGAATLLAVTVPSRLSRFVLVSLLVSQISTRWLHPWSRRRKLWLLGSFWILFYALFLTLMPG